MRQHEDEIDELRFSYEEKLEGIENLGSEEGVDAEKQKEVRNLQEWIYCLEVWMTFLWR